MWTQGKLHINGRTFRFWMKQYDTGAQYGIDGGRISKLTIKEGNAVLANYDRGWDIRPTDPDAQTAVDFFIATNNQ